MMALCLLASPSTCTHTCTLTPTVYDIRPPQPLSLPIDGHPSSPLHSISPRGGGQPPAERGGRAGDAADQTPAMARFIISRHIHASARPR